MPAKTDPTFAPPNDPNVAIWRYMDFTKFVSMLENGGLYFARAHLLGDPFEGSMPRANEKLRKRFGATLHEDVRLMRQHWRKWTLVNCWHIRTPNRTGD